MSFYLQYSCTLWILCFSAATSNGEDKLRNIHRLCNLSNSGRRLHLIRSFPSIVPYQLANPSLTQVDFILLDANRPLLNPCLIVRSLDSVNHSEDNGIINSTILHIDLDVCSRSDGYSCNCGCVKKTTKIVTCTRIGTVLINSIAFFYPPLIYCCFSPC